MIFKWRTKTRIYDRFWQDAGGATGFRKLAYS